MNNVQSLISMALASTGYHLKDKKMLENAYKFLIYLCKEQREDGFWYYWGSEYFEDFGENIPIFEYKVGSDLGDEHCSGIFKKNLM